MERSLLLIVLCVLAATAKLDAEPFHWGINGHPLSQESYWHVPITKQLDLVAELGSGWYRVDLSAGAFAANTARFDELLTQAERREIRLLPVLLSSLDSRSKDATPAQIRAAASDFAKRAVTRYKGRITHWELGNELDAHAMIQKGENTRAGKLWTWDGAPDGSSVDDYEEGRYQKAKAEIQGLYEGVKAADPHALTIVDTAGWLHYGFIERLVKEDRVNFDILAWHWYSEMGDMSRVQGTLDLIALLKRFGKPLWITEINRRDGSKGGKEAEQADYVTKAAKQLGEHPDIKAFFVYELLDEPYFGEDGESSYGLVSVKKTAGGCWEVSGKKPAFTAFRDTIQRHQSSRP